MIVVSKSEFENPLALYRRRWEIETLYGRDADKIEKLLFLLVIRFFWAYRTGDIKAREGPIEMETHGRRARSLFRGVWWIRRAIFGDRKFRRLLSRFMYSQLRTCYFWPVQRQF